jgi:hypothetical protein
MIQKNSAKAATKVCARKKCLGTFFTKKNYGYGPPAISQLPWIPSGLLVTGIFKILVNFAPQNPINY